MRDVSLIVDASEVQPVVAELKKLYGDGRGLPRYVSQQFNGLAEAKRLVEVDWTASRSVATPTPELLALLATLRAIRGHS